METQSDYLTKKKESDKAYLAQLEREKHEARVARHKEWWDKNCPVDCADSTIEKSPNPKATARVMAWKFSKKGLVLHGTTGKGKTCAAWMLLKRENEALHKIKSWDAQELCNVLSAEGFNKLDAFVENQVAADILFIDDLDKASPNEMTQSSLFLIFKQRCEQGKPTIFTTNMVGDKLLPRFKNMELGEAFIRRMRTDCETIAF